MLEIIPFSTWFIRMDECRRADYLTRNPGTITSKRDELMNPNGD